MPKGWEGSPEVALDGSAWPLDFAARILGMDEKDLRDLVRITGLTPVGTVKIAGFRRSGRNPRAYDAAKLTRIYDTIRNLSDTL